MATITPPPVGQQPYAPPPQPARRRAVMLAAAGMAVAGLAIGGGLALGLASSGHTTTLRVPGPTVTVTAAPPAAPLTWSAAKICGTVNGTTASDGTTVTACTVNGTPADHGGTETAVLTESFSDNTAYTMLFALNDSTGNWETVQGPQATGS